MEIIVIKQFQVGSGSLIMVSCVFVKVRVIDETQEKTRIVSPCSAKTH